MKTNAKCKVCGKPINDCWAHCQVAKDGKHEANPCSAQQAGGCQFTVDYNCRHCHQSGGVKINPDDIQWE